MGKHYGGLFQEWEVAVATSLVKKFLGKSRYHEAEEKTESANVPLDLIVDMNWTMMQSHGCSLENQLDCPKRLKTYKTG